jgi:hypothetical protein
MNVELTPHAAELLETVRAQRKKSVELIVERALETFVREQHLEQTTARTGPKQAVREMLDFVKQNRVRLDPGLSAKDLIREGQAKNSARHHR